MFLGDAGHHKPAERFAQLEPVLKQRGIVMRYTDDLDDLNPDNLARYDTVIIYANHEVISKEGEQALLNFVENGGGLVPIHCASFCFQNSPDYIKLVGAQFKSHGTGVFAALIVNPTHPVTEGLEEFETWDETYIHHQHNPDRQILMVRRENSREEPWTWVRTFGRGRVFYTAYGHDHRTWSDPGFHKLVEKGIRWVALESAEKQNRTDVKPLEYTEAVIPNYLADQPGKSTEPLRKMQLPLEPAESMQRMRVADGFAVKLFAAEPDIVKPVAMTWDARGRLWLAETVDYPNERKPDGQGRDRIKICEDTDGDGRADKFTVFAEGLSIPTSLVVARDGVIVSQAPHMLFLKDTNGDGRADVRQVLFSGWETWDTHAGPSSLRWGFDNWIWGTVGYAGFKGRVGGKQREFRQGFFRFRPDGSELEFLGSTSNNTWGLGFSEEGFVFGSTANNQHSIYLGIPNRYYEAVSGWFVARVPGIADHWRFHPLKKVVRQVDWHGGYTAAAGHSLYTARSFPKPFWNRAAFVNEPTGSLLHKCILRREGTHFVSHDAENLLASDDEWTAPIAAEVGPDGAVWVIDWYNYIVQHNPTPHGFKTGKGNAYEDPLRDRKHGRIYRIVYNRGRKSQPPSLQGAAPEHLVAALGNDNLFWRLTAQRLLYERGKRDVLPKLLELARDRRLDEVGLNPGALHALWTLHGLGALDGSNAAAFAGATQALKHPSAAVRRTAIEVLPKTTESQEAILRSKLVEDSDAHVRLAALLALSQMPASAEAARSLVAMLKGHANVNDRWIPDGITASAARHANDFLKAAAADLKLSTEPGGEVETNLVANPSFEEQLGSKPLAWGFRALQGQAEHRFESFSRSGGRSIKILSADGTIARWTCSVEVTPHTEYRLSGWIKSQGIEKQEGSGALLEVQEFERVASTSGVTGTKDWTQVETTFNSGASARLRISCTLGGEAPSKGSAWFDDVELRELGTGINNRVNRIVRTVATDYAHRAPVEGVVSLLATLKDADTVLGRSILDGLEAGWSGRRAPRLSDADKAQIALLMQQLPGELRDRLVLLADRWGWRDAFSADIAAVVKKLRKAVGDAKLSPDRRAEAASQLIRLDNGPETIREIVTQVTPQANPSFVRALLNSLAESPSPEVGNALVGHWNSLTPGLRRAAIAILMRRASWTNSLLDAIQKESIDYKELKAEQVQQLTLHLDLGVAQRAKRLALAKGRSFSSDRQKVVERLLPVAGQSGDPAHGRIVFEKNCSRCHVYNSVGRSIGPDLTGTGKRNRADILVDILDPSRSVEGNYRLWIVSTKDGQLLTGRLDGETQATLQLLDDSGQRQVIRRDNIAQVRASRLSIMPDGFEQHLSPKDLASLLEYLTRTSRAARN